MSPWETLFVNNIPINISVNKPDDWITIWSTDGHLKEASFDSQEFMLRFDIILTPSTLVKFAENGKLQADITGKLLYQQSYWAGLGYRTGHAIILMAGLSVDKLIFGYAFDIGLNSIMKYSFGTHEFTFIAKFGDNARRYRWLNRF